MAWSACAAPASGEPVASTTTSTARPASTATTASTRGTRLTASQVRSHAFFDAVRPNYHRLHVLPDYGHLDVIIGKDAARDVFPLVLRELDDPAGGGA